MRARPCARARVCVWEGRLRGNNGVESVHVTEKGSVGGQCIQISMIMRAGTQPNCLPERKQLCMLGVCVCVDDVHYMRVPARGRQLTIGQYVSFCEIL